jgi:hypothetical protein
MSKTELDDDLTPIKKFKRKLTPFLCHEMLYDFATGQLDEDRKGAVEEFLKTDNEGQRLLEGIHEGLLYTGSLANTQISEAVKTHLQQSENVASLGRRYSTWKEWPETFRWSVLAIVVSTVVAGGVAVVPWNKISFHRSKSSDSSDSVDVAQIPKSSAESAIAQNEVGALEEQGSGDEGDSGAAESESSGDDVADHSDAASAAAAAAALAPKPVAPIAATTPAPTATPVAPNVPPKTQAAAAQAAEPGVESESESTSPHEAKAKGFVYRAFMNLANLDDVGPKITDAIRELGGEKAGEVELGWKRGTGRYYHFSLPEDNEKKVLERLQVYGPVRISKDPHPRVMPQGQVRFILWIESTDH